MLHGLNLRIFTMSVTTRSVLILWNYELFDLGELPMVVSHDGSSSCVSVDSNKYWVERYKLERWFLGRIRFSQKGMYRSLVYQWWLYCHSFSNDRLGACPMFSAMQGFLWKINPLTINPLTQVDFSFSSSWHDLITEGLHLCVDRTNSWQRRNG